jgi:phage gp37-like protein
MKAYMSEMAILLVGTLTTAVAWFLGGKQKATNEKTDSITVGVDRIVETSNRMIERFERLLEDESQRLASEKSHREMCEVSLREHKMLIDVLNDKVKKLENQMKKL